MRETFGPPDSAEDDRLARGLQKVEELKGSPATYQWLYEDIKDGFSDGATQARHVNCICFHCGSAAPTSSCSKCGVAYCSRSCQVADWKMVGGAHKMSCHRYKLLGRSQRVPPEARRLIISELLGRFRLYLCPFAVHHQQAHGAGLLLVLSESSLSELALPSPKDVWGRPLHPRRSLVLQYATRADLDGADLRESFGGSLPELLPVIAHAVETYDQLSEVVVLLRCRGGLTVALLCPLVPDFNVCRTLADDYKGKDALQFDLDENESEPSNLA